MVMKDKEHSKQFKKRRMTVRKKIEALEKVDKKLKKQHGKVDLIQQRNNLLCQLQEEERKMYCQERSSLQDISHLERSIYSRIAIGLKPVVSCELAMCWEMEQLGEIVNKLDNCISESNKDNYQKAETLFAFNANNEKCRFFTPPSTPGCSTLGSRTSSIRSINSFSRSSSVAGSVNDDKESFRSRNNSVSSYQVIIMLR